jgi:hypothetical protein
MALKGRIDWMLWEQLRRFVGLTIYYWRYRKRQGRRIIRDDPPLFNEPRAGRDRRTERSSASRRAASFDN